MNLQGNTLACWASHILDLYHVARFDFVRPRTYTKFRNIKALKKRTNARVFVETGTFLGNTTHRCSKVFEKVVTVELDEKLHQNALNRFRRYSNVECIKGDALKEIGKIMDRSDIQDALIYLDGHFSGERTALGDMAEPACEEIKVLGPYANKIAGIVVDDFRLFGVDEGWPKRWELLREIEACLGHAFEYTVHLDQVIVWRKRN
ncbi:MAG: hypothetical protein HC898_04570 [Phycisphaerales bacterium]|nr:hypothetical protein [Phycisphaerales bacterium]